MAPIESPPSTSSPSPAEQAAALGFWSALGGGAIQKVSRFLHKKTLSPFLGRVAGHRFFSLLAPIGILSIGYNALQAGKRLSAGKSDDRLADRIMVGAALCGIVSMVRRFNPRLRGLAALVGLALDAADLTRVGWKWKEGQVSTGDLLLQAGLTLMFGLDRESRAAVMGLKVPRGTGWVGAAFEARRPISAASRPGPKRPPARPKRPRQPKWELNEERVDLSLIHDGVARRIAQKGVQELSLLLVAGPRQGERPQFLFQVRLMDHAVGKLRLQIKDGGNYEISGLSLSPTERIPSLEGWGKITSPEICDILNEWVALQNRLRSDGRPPRIGGGSGTPPSAKRAILTFFDGSKRVVQPKEVLILGSARQANLFLEGEAFAAGIRYQDGWIIQPFESSVRINDRIILDSEALKDGDRILIGEKPISFEIEKNVPFVEEKNPQSLGRRSYAVKGAIDIPIKEPLRKPD